MTVSDAAIDEMFTLNRAGLDRLADLLGQIGPTWVSRTADWGRAVNTLPPPSRVRRSRRRDLGRAQSHAPARQAWPDEVVARRYLCNPPDNEAPIRIRGRGRTGGECPRREIALMGTFGAVPNSRRATRGPTRDPLSRVG
jgi:hypothetical protein